MDGKERQVNFLEKFKATKDEVQTTNLEFLYRPRPGDVIVFGPPKCGTTWMQNILHQIRTKGDGSFEKHDEETWFILHPKKAVKNLNADQKFNPRIFKCHLNYGIFDDLSVIRNIVVVRDPYDAAYSYSKFRYRMFGDDSDVQDQDEADFLRKFYDLNEFDYFHIFQTWWPRRNDTNVFWIFYEDIQKNMKSVIRQVADFVNVELTESELERICKFCTFEFMAENKEKFQPNTARMYNGLLGTEETWAPTSVVREGGGQIGQGRRRLGPKVKATVDELWSKTITKDFGYKNYDEIYAKNCRFE